MASRKRTIKSPKKRGTIKSTSARKAASKVIRKRRSTKKR